jgi:hypothetical protein
MTDTHAQPSPTAPYAPLPPPPPPAPPDPWSTPTLDAPVQDADKVVQSVFDACYKDVEPFGGIPT